MNEGNTISMDEPHHKSFFLEKRLNHSSMYLHIFKAKLREEDHPQQDKYVILKMLQLPREPRYELVESHRMMNFKHEEDPRILGIKTFYVSKEGVFVIEIPYMDTGNLRQIVSSSPSFNNGGLSEDCIAFVLKEILSALKVIHGKLWFCRDLSTASIYVNNGEYDNKPCVKLGYKDSIYDYTQSSANLSLKSITKWAAPPEVLIRQRIKDMLIRRRESFMDTMRNRWPIDKLSDELIEDLFDKWFDEWAVPRKIELDRGNPIPSILDQKGDIWRVGITALELVYGCTNFVKNRDELDEIIKDIKTKKKYLLKVAGVCCPSGSRIADLSDEFVVMLDMCFDNCPSNRPSTGKLLLTDFFRNKPCTDIYSFLPGC